MGVLAASADDLGRAAEVVFRSRVGVPLERVSLTGIPIGGPGTVEGRVTIRGAWKGEAVIRCQVGLARRLGAEMYSVPPHQVQVHHIQSAVGQMTSLVAEGLKTVLPHPCRVGRPRVCGGCDTHTPSPDGSVQEARFECDDELLAILLIGAQSAVGSDAASGARGGVSA